MPQILVLTVGSEIAEPRRKERIARLIDLLDVDFEEHPPGIEAPLKAARQETFSALNSDQSRAIYHWLEFVRSNYDCSPFRKEIDSAVNYWSNRAG